jgi:hypothetical protein
VLLLLLSQLQKQVQGQVQMLARVLLLLLAALQSHQLQLPPHHPAGCQRQMPWAADLVRALLLGRGLALAAAAAAAEQPDAPYQR